MSNFDRGPLSAIKDPYVYAERRFAIDFDPTSKHVVYFLEAEGLDIVKIGYSMKELFSARLTNIATCCPAPLKVMTRVPGGRDLEQNFHHCFWNLKTHHEWFRLTAELRLFIKHLSFLSEKLCKTAGVDLDPDSRERAICRALRLSTARERTMIRARLKAARLAESAYAARCAEVTAS